MNMPSKQLEIMLIAFKSCNTSQPALVKATWFFCTPAPSCLESAIKPAWSPLFNNSDAPSTRVSSHSITKKTTRAQAKTSCLHGKCNYVTTNCKLVKELEVSNAVHMGSQQDLPKAQINLQRKKHLMRLLRISAPVYRSTTQPELQHIAMNIDSEIDEILEYDALVKETRHYSLTKRHMPF
ncbi:hypothetical protein BCV72DRAFT_333146 [Rhizopus microsporus var. microsporus]|uniref:Uncharacterized protein n=1 Tax=Rhizopus microsporus var. microsporus TaxID=86635 RepID=A0A1X0RDQ3_RHIZD|nr:hypothetical protein BCV72DRAFT_333146 [Rhizopus microsporus var. microsporus]